MLLGAVISVDPAWKMKTALELPSASSVSVPVNPRVAEPYTPAFRVVPPSSVGTAVTGRPAGGVGVGAGEVVLGPEGHGIVDVLGAVQRHGREPGHGRPRDRARHHR